jgi:hypothetical protein
MMQQKRRTTISPWWPATVLAVTVTLTAFLVVAIKSRPQT